MSILRSVLIAAALATSAGLAGAQNADSLPAPDSAHRPIPLLVDVPQVDRLHLTTSGRIIEDTSGLNSLGRQVDGGTYSPRTDCPAVLLYSQDVFNGGTFTLQGGFAQGEIEAASYTLPGSLFPLKISLMEFILGQQNAITSTVTQWSILVWDGTPNSPQPTGFPVEYSSDDVILPHVRMGPGTNATNVQVSVDPSDPDQIYIYNPNGDATHTFTIGLRIDVHNNQTADPCYTAPPANSNAFPATDNTVVGCGTGYAQLNNPTNNWLFAVNCGPNGCPPNGGWTRFSQLQTDQNILGFCITGCRPRGDWVIRCTYDPINCPPPNGACCFGTQGCFISDQASCVGSGGSWKGPGSSCGTRDAQGNFPGCVAPPNQPPVANAGNDQTVTDADNSGAEVVSLDGSASSDPDGFIANFRWTEGATLLQDGPAFLSVSLPVGLHTVTLTVTDNAGATASDTVQVDVVPGGCRAVCDVNGDGSNDIGDVFDLADALASGGNVPDPGACKDFNQDGSEDTSDVLDIANAIASGTCP